MQTTDVIAGTTKKYDIPLGHLDFHYIQQCSDVKELEKILKVLRTKEEGFYPQLEICCEERIKNLNPESRVLRKDKPLYTMNDLDRNEREELEKELQNWPSDIQSLENSMAGQQTDIMDEGNSDLPPVRSGTITLTAQGAKTSKPETKTSKKVMPREYKDWDKVDVEEELKKVDADDDKKGKERSLVANRDMHDLPDHIDAKGLSEGEKLLKANREKDKGNEAFKSGDFKEAVKYYNRSISLLPTAASYNNRALAYLKTSEWQKAVSDTDKVLAMEPDNVKALLRRGTAYKGLKQLEKAGTDIGRVLELEPNNKKAQELLEEIDKDRKEKKKKGRRMVIEDVEGGEETEELVKGDTFSKDTSSEGDYQSSGSNPKDINKQEQKISRRMKIEEVESDSEEEIEEITIRASESVKFETEKADVVVNGHASVAELKENPPQSENEQNSKDVSKQIWEDSEVNSTNNDQMKEEAQNDNNKHSDISEKTDERTRDESNVPETEVEEKAEVENTEDTTNGQDAADDPEEDSESDSETETEFVDAPEELKRPVFHMTELPKQAVKMKEDATTLFKNGQYGEASSKYSEVIKILDKAEDQTVNLSVMYSNRAACHLKTGDLPGAVKDCNASLQLVPHSVKPLLRRASAYEHLERYSVAYVDYRHALLLDSRIDQAHLGTKRCQQMLHEKDGPRWREKIHLQKVSPWQIPEIIGLDGKSTNPSITHQPPSVSQSNLQSATSSQSNFSVNTHSPAPKEVPEKKKPEMTPQEKFDKLKAEGNNFVKEGKFREALESYNSCEEVLPGQVAIYTNRALCYIRTNQAEEAEEDCTRALAQEKDNVKALFRRAQARKMLKRYRDALEDLKHLLSVDPKNTAAKKEMDVIKDYWRKELESMKKNIVDLKEKKEEMKNKTGDSKQRKRMVIQEVESEEEEKSSSASQTSARETKGIKTDPKQASKPVQNSKDSKPVQSQTGSSKKEKGGKKKSTIKETSQGLPSVPKSAPKLDKATPYEFISAWNALKKSETVKPYYELLKQIKPCDIKTVISNKIDGAMLSVITKCVAEHYLPNGEADTSYEILKNLSAVPRFSTVAMFMSAPEKAEVRSVFDRLESLPSTVYSAKDIQKLRKDYSV